MIRRIGQRLDALLELAQRGQAGRDRLIGNPIQHVGSDRVPEIVEIIDEPASRVRQVQPVGAAVLGIVPALEQALLNQPVQQPHQRDRLQFQHFREIDLRKSLLRAQPKQHNPLRACGAARFGTMINIVAQDARAFDKLGDQLPPEVQRHVQGHVPRVSSKLSNCLGFFKQRCVYTLSARILYLACWERF
ncbi:hypothetical protein BRAS3843_1780051 [Bradyrhizobium sp. STM 3843]|nr:hypothetical protein BRAS3843_1780051 [Bradyrhizobium sp. STM 3843]